MNANVYDIALLLGYEYIESQFKGEDLERLNLFSMNKTRFMKFIPSLIQMVYVADQYRIFKFLHPSKYLLRLMKKEDKKSGICLVCDQHFHRIKKHYIKIHKMTRRDVEKLLTLFGQDSIFFMPAEFKQVELPEPLRVTTLPKPPKELQIKEEKPTVEGSLYGKFEGFYMVKAQSGVDLILICENCGHIVSRKSALQHKRIHNKPKILSYEVGFLFRRKRKQNKFEKFESSSEENN